MNQNIILNLGGGGSNPLNFKVVGSPKPPNPKENTIWVNTDTEITAWDFSATEPYRRSKTKNRLCYPFYNTTQTVGGITWTDNGDGTVTANGTTTDGSRFRPSHHPVSAGLVWLEPGTYTISGGIKAGAYFQVYDGLNSKTLANDKGSGATFTLTEGTAVRTSLIINEGISVSNAVFKPQIEKGSSATSFVKGDASGQAWFCTAASSPVEFNALKKNGIMVYPLTAKQYVGGAWVDKTAKSYQGGAWVDWLQPLYLLSGGEYESGYEFEKYSGSGGAMATTTGAVVFKITDSNYATFYCKKQIDVTNYRTVKISVSGGYSKYDVDFGFVSTKKARSGETQNIFDVASARFTPSDDNIAATTKTIDLSSVSGTLWFGCSLAGSSVLSSNSTYGVGGIKVTTITFE